MTNGIDKKALFKLKSEPYLKPISDLGVGFYNLDENTAILRFQLSNTKGPLLIHENNLTAYAYFESTNGSASDVIELEIEDSMNGIVTITLDKEFLQASTSTKVKGQVYIGVNNVDGKPEYNEVAVFREFTFEVADALINKISSFTKIEYIRMFSQLKERIEQQVRDIEEAIANGADYVAEMKSVLQKGIETLNAIVSNGKQDIQTVINQAKGDLTKVRDDATEDITTTANNAKTSVQDTASTAINSIDSKTTEATEHVDAKVTEFNQTVLDNELVTPEQLTTNLDALTWQKRKLTQDDGIRIEASGVDPVELDTGFYQIWNTNNMPQNTANDSGTYWNVDVTTGANDTKQIFAVLSGNGKAYLKNIHGGVDGGWKELTNNQTDTGWVPFTIINGGRANTVYPTRGGYKCSYRTITNGSVTERRVRVNADNIAHGQVIAQLPSNFVKELQVGYIRSTGDHNATNLLIEKTGEVKVYIANDSAWGVSDSKYIYGEISWIE